MNTPLKTCKLFFLFALLVFLPTACGPSNNVRLLPLPAFANAPLPTPNAPSVAVVLFEDTRMDQSNIGTRRDHSVFVTNDNVAQWVSKSLAEELANNGLLVSFALNTDQARKGNPDYLILGQLSEVTLQETSATEIASSMQASFSLANRQKRIMRETMRSAQTYSGLPSGNAANNLMLNTLRELVKPMAQKIIQTIGVKK